MREEHLYGRHPVLEALRSGRTVDKVYLQEGTHEAEAMREIRRRLREQHIPFTVVPKTVLDRIAQGGAHQGVAAMMSIRDYAAFEDVLARARERGEDPLVVVLDEVQDPRNLGSLLRTADAAGFHGAVIPERRATGFTGVVSKAAAGADAYVPVVRIVNVVRFLEELAEQGFQVVGADSGGTVDYREARYEGPLAVVLGGEQKGLGRLVERHCHQVVRIPMRGEVGSLNVSVAGALVMYEAVRNRIPTGKTGDRAEPR